MRYCTGNCKQGRTLCTCRGIQMDAGKGERQLFLHYEQEHVRMNKFVKIILLLGALYFLGHIGYALAQSSPTVPAPIIQCWSNGMGTIQCVQL